LRQVKLRLALACAGAVALVGAAPAAAFTPSNSYYPKQWYLAQDHAFDAWQAPPPLAPVKVAVIDSGVDCNLPDFQGRIAASQSFVGGNACNDTEGHGTIVAGEIAADLDSSGIVGIAYSAQLLVAKVVGPDGSIPLSAESRAIRWAANQGARVINLSFGAVRDPRNSRIDTYSRIEASAVAYAQSKGALVVAAAGNADEAPSSPWNYASWPAALPHVIGVAALGRSGAVPEFSDRDSTFVDIAAPGVDIFSTFPAALTAQQQGCQDQGYTDCAAPGYTHPEGTSFAAPQVSAAAAVLFGLDPVLTAGQVGTLLERSTDDVNASNGCADCAAGRDRYTGWGRLDVQSAVAVVNGGSIPAEDRLEPNDSIAQAGRLTWRSPRVKATLDYWDDPVDVYRVRLQKGSELGANVHASWRNAHVHLLLLDGKGAVRAGRAATPGPKQHFSFRAPRSGWYYVELRASRHGGGSYTLRLRKTAPRAA
jgi:subtilisin family serine protease